MSTNNRSGAAQSAQKSHADIIAEMRKYRDLVITGKKYANRLEAALKRERGKGRRRKVRLCEFATTSLKKTCGNELFAWARYKRGDVPTHGEFAYIDGRVKAKFPNAELVYMKRRFAPVASPAEPTEVWWEFNWIVFNRKEGEKK